MKNFKKVISVVIALALVISSFTAVSASKFADVADTANYAEAVGALAALGVVNGTEENGALVFKPENQVTRAEAATMIVGALNLADEAKASAGTSQFADVNAQAAWAAGYVNVGVAQGFIKGYDASTFGPLDNVTYAQLCVMLTSIAGYGELAASRGGWPSGYTTTAAQFGMSKGVSAAADTALTKGQVAVMIYNTLQVPMLGVSEFNMLANSYEQLNGKDDKMYKTLLSDKFGGYVAQITITDTPASKGDYEDEYVDFTVVKADFWPEVDEAVKTSAPVANQSAKFDVDVNAAHLQTAAALFVEDEDGELVLVYFGAAEGKKTQVYEAADYVFQADVSSKYNFEAKSQLKFGSKYVKLDDKDSTIEVYVNGVKDEAAAFAMGDDLEGSEFEQRMQMANGQVRITETEDKDGDTVYSIFLTCYEVAKVTSVDVDDDESVIYVTKTAFGTDVDTIKINAEAIEDGYVTVSVKKNGAAADVEDLKKGDIIAFATDLTKLTAGKIEVSGNIDILATDDVVTGVVKSVDEDEYTYTIDGTDYYVLGLAEIIAKGEDKDEYKENVVNITANTIDAELDPFGRIFGKKVSATSDKYAIVLQYAEDEDLILLLADGTKQVFDASDVDVNSTAIDVLEAADAAKAIKDRVITYTVRTRTGEFTGAKKASADDINGEYNTKTKKLDGNRVTDGTLIINAVKAVEDKLTKASNYESFAADTLAADAPYKGFAFGASSDTTPFIILTSIDVVFGDATRLAVVLKINANAQDDDGDDIDEVIALYEGSQQTLVFEDDAAADLGVGDVFLFEKNAEDQIDIAHIVYDKSESKFYSFDKIGALAGKYDAEDWSFSLVEDKIDYQLVRGIVVDVTDTEVTFANWKADLSKIDTNEEIEADDDIYVASYAYADGLKAYIYDTQYDDTNKEIDKFRAKDASTIKPSNFAKFDQNDDGIFGEDEFKANMEDYANEAIALIVDGDIVDIYVIQK